MLKDRLSKTSGWQFHKGFSGLKSFRDFRETGPWTCSMVEVQSQKGMKELTILQGGTLLNLKIEGRGGGLS